MPMKLSALAIDSKAGRLFNIALIADPITWKRYIDDSSCQMLCFEVEPSNGEIWRGSMRELSKSLLRQTLVNINRNLTMVVRRNPKLRLMFPSRMLKYVTRTRYHLSHSFLYITPVIYKSCNVNIYHCCVHKTGSQWIKSLLSDIITYQYSGMAQYSYQSRFHDGYDPRSITDRSFTEPFPEDRIISPLYVTYQNFQDTPKPIRYKAFFILRDPREILISWYFSAKFSHIPIGYIPELRSKLRRLSFTDSMLFAIDYLDEFGLFGSMRSWKEAEGKDSNIVLVRYEDLVTSSLESFGRLFTFLDIGMTPATLLELIQIYSFKRLSGRNVGTEDTKSHIRKGGSGSWKRHFNEKIESRFSDVTGDLVQRLGYE